MFVPGHLSLEALMEMGSITWKSEVLLYFKPIFPFAEGFASISFSYFFRSHGWPVTRMSGEVFWLTKMGVRMASRRIWPNIYIMYIYSTCHSPPALAASPPCSFPAPEPWQKGLFSYSQVAFFPLSNGHIPQIFLGVQRQASKPEQPRGWVWCGEENSPQVPGQQLSWLNGTHSFHLPARSGQQEWLSKHVPVNPSMA